MGGGKRRPIRDSDDEAEQQLVPRPPKKRAIKDEKAREAEAEEDDDDDGGDGEANEDEDEEFEVDCIIKKRWAGKTRTWEYLVHWKGYGVGDRTWEPEANLVDAADALEDFKRKEGIISEAKTTKARGRTSTASNTERRHSKVASASASEASSVPADQRKPASDKKANARSKKRALMAEDTDEEDPDAHLAESFGASEEKDTSWTQKYADKPSWAAYVKEVVTIESSAKDGIKVLVKWKDGKTRFITNAQARDKIPNVMLDFYEQHLTFAGNTADDDDDVANGV